MSIIVVSSQNVLNTIRRMLGLNVGDDMKIIISIIIMIIIISTPNFNYFFNIVTYFSVCLLVFS